MSSNIGNALDKVPEMAEKKKRFEKKYFYYLKELICTQIWLPILQMRSKTDLLTFIMRLKAVSFLRNILIAKYNNIISTKLNRKEMSLRGS